MGLPPFALDDVDGAQAWLASLDKEPQKEPEPEKEPEQEPPEAEPEVSTEKEPETPPAKVAPQAPVVASADKAGAVAKELEEAKKELAKLKTDDGRARKLADEKRQLENELADAKRQLEEAVKAMKAARAQNPLSDLTADELESIDRPTAELVLRKAEEIAEAKLEAKLEERLSALTGGDTELRERLDAQVARLDARDAEINTQRQRVMNEAIAKEIPLEVYTFINENPEKWATFCNSRYGSTTEGELYQGALNSSDASAAIAQLKKFASLNNVELPEPKSKQPLKVSTRSGGSPSTVNTERLPTYEQAQEYMNAAQHGRVPSFLKDRKEMDAWLNKAIAVSAEGKLRDKNGNVKAMPY